MFTSNSENKIQTHIKVCILKVKALLIGRLNRFMFRVSQNVSDRSVTTDMTIILGTVHHYRRHHHLHHHPVMRLAISNWSNLGRNLASLTPDA
jgi:hypothetical protein